MEDDFMIIGKFRGREEEEYMGIFDGHGGSDASSFAASNLHIILEQKLNETGNIFS